MKFQELPRRALDLSLAIYRVTAKFPQGEVLVGQMREVANQIAAEVDAMGDEEQIKKNISRLRVYFKIAKSQNWIKKINWSVLEFEYCKMHQGLNFGRQEGSRAERSAVDNRGDAEKAKITSHNIKEVKKQPKNVSYQVVDNLPLRQDRILKVVQNKGLVKMSDLAPLFKDDVSERTLRNELQGLVKSGLIKKRGEKKHTEYYAG